MHERYYTSSIKNEKQSHSAAIVARVGERERHTHRVCVSTQWRRSDAAGRVADVWPNHLNQGGEGHKPTHTQVGTLSQLDSITSPDQVYKPICPSTHTVDTTNLWCASPFTRDQPHHYDSRSLSLSPLHSLVALFLLTSN